MQTKTGCNELRTNALHRLYRYSIDKCIDTVSLKFTIEHKILLIFVSINDKLYKGF